MLQRQPRFYGPLDTLAAMECLGRKIAILGDMFELGRISEQAHVEIGAYAAERCDNYSLWVDGPQLLQGAGRGEVFAAPDDLLRSLPQVRSGDLVLVKASCWSSLERVWSA